MSIETYKAIEVVRDTLNERADDNGEDGWAQISEAWQHILSKVKPDGKGARNKIEFLIDRLCDLDVWCAELVIDSQDVAEASPGFDSHFKNDETGEPICVPEDANPTVDGVRCNIDEAMTALQTLLDSANCPTCGARPEETHPRECSDFEQQRKDQEKNITETFGNNSQWKAELNIEWDGEDLVSWCHVSTTRNGMDYCSSLVAVEAYRTVEGDDMQTDDLKVPDAIYEAIKTWAEANGY